MLELWKPVLALILASLASAAGTIGLRVASDQNNLALAIIGALGDVGIDGSAAGKALKRM